VKTEGDDLQHFAAIHCRIDRGCHQNMSQLSVARVRDGASKACATGTITLRADEAGCRISGRAHPL
jgi:hypothetical protein